MSALQKKTVHTEIKESWDEDKLGRNEVAEYLTPIIASIKQPFVISLNSPYGTGKTFFIEHWKKQLEEKHGHETIYFNAWETDFDKEPLIPIISLILEKIGKNEGMETVTNALKIVLGSAALTINQMLKHATGLDPYETGQRVEADKKGKTLESIGEELYRHYTFKQSAYKTLKEELPKYIEALPKKPLIIFIDELDRCRPDYAIEVLECIKHLFSVKGIVFILAIDEEQLRGAIASVYGTTVDGEGYLRKFIDWQLFLPKPTYRKYAEALFEQFALAETEQFTEGSNIFSGRDTFIKTFSILAEAFELTLRQQAQCFTKTTLVVRSLPPNASPLSEALAAIVVLKEVMPDEMHAYCIDRKDPEELLKRLDDSLSTKKKELFKNIYGSWERFRPRLHAWFIDDNGYDNPNGEISRNSSEHNQMNSMSNITSEQSQKRDKQQKELLARHEYLEAVKSVYNNYTTLEPVAETIYMRLEKASFLSVRGL